MTLTVREGGGSRQSASTAEPCIAGRGWLHKPSQVRGCAMPTHASAAAAAAAAIDVGAV
jgi:hypothetical protein